MIIQPRRAKREQHVQIDIVGQPSEKRRRRSAQIAEIPSNVGNDRIVLMQLHASTQRSRASTARVAYIRRPAGGEKESHMFGRVVQHRFVQRGVTCAVAVVGGLCAVDFGQIDQLL